MQWDEALNRLENDVIKTDVMASSEADFMATHMPFSNLHLILHGQIQGKREKTDEEEIFNTLIKNPENRHRVIIVRGPNGAGKSHLIRWFNSRLLSDPDVFNPANEKIIFIRRLGNTLRGAVAQLLEEGVITDEQIKERMVNFINSVDNQDENTFKSTIYYNFITQIENDHNSEAFTSAEKRDIAAFLNDLRVKNELMQANGPIARFYAQIAKPKEVVFGGEAVFVPEDFNFERSLLREIRKDCSSEARRFLNRLEDDKEKLTVYLNSFTGSVISRCSNISQGDARDIFGQLRRELKKQGKNLTILIEDFTTFTGIDAELITVLSTEHGGANDDYCRVTAIIGITDAYYEQFKDNFTDRVTHQIEVGEEAYGSREALSHMAALYLNASFCSKEIIQKWYDNGAKTEDLPIAQRNVPLDWESVNAGPGKLTLYPFNIKALTELYSRLNHKTPREFLKHVILNQLAAYLRDQHAGENSRFPYTAFKGSTVQLSKLTHASHIDNLNISENEKKRLRVLLCIWGEGHASAGEKNGIATIGSLPKKFFEVMGFNTFFGIGTKDTDIKNPVTSPPPVREKLPKQTPADRQEQQYNERIRDIEGWYQNKENLRFSADLRNRLYEFLATSINWQYEGVSAYLASKRYRISALLYIEGQQQEGNPNKAAVNIKRTPANRDVLVALTMYNYYKSWGFEGGPYFQLRLVSWLEEIKPSFVRAVKGETEGEKWPVFKWALTAEYLRLGIMGYLHQENDWNTLKPLLYNKNNLNDINISHPDGKWGQLQELINKRYAEDFRKNKDIIIQMENTYMGFINQTGGTVHFFDLYDIEETIKELHDKEWDIEDELPELKSQSRDFTTLSLNLLKTFFPRIKEVLKKEQDIIDQSLNDLKRLAGMDINPDNLKMISNSIIELFTTMNQRGLNYKIELKTRVDKLYENADKIAQQYNSLKQSLDNHKLSSLLQCYSTNPLQVLQEAVSTVSEVYDLAEEKSSEFMNNLTELEASQDIDESMVEAALEELKKLYEDIVEMEVES